MSGPMVVGHKGASAVAPENTLASFRRALELGAGGLECDIRASRDGVPVIIHDATVDRTTDASGEIAALSLRELKAANACCGMKDFDGERIPTLDELLGLVAGRALLALEYKSLDAVEPSIAVLKRHDADQWCTAWAFNPDVLMALRRLLPSLTRTQNVGRVESWQEVLDTARVLDCVGVSLAQQAVERERVDSARALGLTFYTWTANDAADWRRLIECGVDAIVTDDPGGLKAYLEAARA